MSSENEVDVIIGGEDAGLVAAINEAKEQLEGFAESVEGIKESISGFGEAFAEAFAIEAISEWVEGIAESGEQLSNMSEILGISIQDLAELSAEAKLAGLSQETMVSATEKLERAMSKAAGGDKQLMETFESIGISGEKLKDMLQNPKEALETLFAKIGSYADGPNKVALAMSLLGRSGAQLIPMMNEMASGAGEYSEAMKNLADEQSGYAQSEKSTAEQLTVMKASWSTLSSTLEATLKPGIDVVVQALTELAQQMDSLVRNNQAVQTGMLALDYVIEGLVGGFRILIATAESIIDIFYAIGQVTGELITLLGYTFVGAWQGLTDVVHIFGETCMAIFGTIGQAITDLSNGQFRQAASDILNVWDNVKQATQKNRDDLHAIDQRYDQEVSSTFHSITDDVNHGWDSIRETATSAISAIIGEVDQMGQAMRAEDNKPQAPTPPKPGAEKTMTQEWETQLKQMETDAGGSYRNLAQMEVDYWQQKLAICEQGTEQYKQVQAKLVDAQAKVANQNKAISDEDASNQLELAKSVLEQKKSLLEDEVAQGEITEQQKFAKLIEYTNQEYQIELAALQHKMSLYDQDTLEYKKMLDKEEQLEQQHANQIQTIETQAATATQRAWQKTWDTVEQEFNSVLSGMLSGTETWKQALGKILDDVFMMFVKMCEDQLGKWLFTETAKTTATTAGNAARNASDATQNAGFLAQLGDQLAQWLGLETAKTASATASAAEQSAANVAAATGAAGLAAAYAYADSMELGPPGMIAAPAVAAAALATGLGFASLASFDVGAWNLPRDMVAQLHQGEMIIPKPFADDFRQNAGSVGSDRQSVTQSVTYAPIITHNAPVRLEGLLQSEHNAMLKWVSKNLRNGAIR